MIDKVDANELKGSGNKGPQIEKTKKAQQAVDEFVESDLDVASVDWREIDADFDQAKLALNYRINHTKHTRSGDPKVADVSMRSNREKSKVYLVHSERVDL